MFKLILATGENHNCKIIYENSAFICQHRSTIITLAQEIGAIIVHNNEIYFETEEEMHSFASTISSL